MFIDPQDYGATEMDLINLANVSSIHMAGARIIFRFSDSLSCLWFVPEEEAQKKLRRTVKAYHKGKK